MSSERLARSTVAVSGSSCGASKVAFAAGPGELVPTGRPDLTQQNHVFGRLVSSGTSRPSRFHSMILRCWRALFSAIVPPDWKLRAGFLLDSGREKASNSVVPKAGGRPYFDVFTIGLLSKSGRGYVRLCPYLPPGPP